MFIKTMLVLIAVIGLLNLLAAAAVMQSSAYSEAVLQHYIQEPTDRALERIMKQLQEQNAKPRSENPDSGRHDGSRTLRDGSTTA